MSEAYTTDFSTWVQQTAKLLREERWQEVDLVHLVEEVEDLGKAEKRGIASQLTRLLLHLLKRQYQPERRSESWLDSITDVRLQIELAIQDSPSLKTYPLTQLEKSYLKARVSAAKQTRSPLSAFPAGCPFSIDNILNEDWLPEK